MLIKAARILDFDIENRPLSYLGQDFTTCEPTAIAASWDIEGNNHISVWLLGPYSAREMLQRFRAEYDQADMVTGHNIISHDLPILNGAMLENELPPLTPILVCDTYADLKNVSGISKSQESLSAMLNIHAPKIGMNQAAWREANRMTPEGIKNTGYRVEGDVRQHRALRSALLSRNLLRAPRQWSP